jgi:ATP-dependent HslUV protease subunit HslV
VSTIVVVQKNGIAAIAADTLSSTDEGKDSAEYVLNHYKIIHVGSSFIAISGPSSMKLAMSDYFAKGADDIDLSSVDAIYRSWLKLHAALKKHYFLNPKDDDASFESSNFQALIANPNGIFGVAEHRSVEQFARFYAFGTGSLHALGAMHALYMMPDRTPEDIARAGIEAAAAFDLHTGLPIISYSLPLL